MSYYKNSYSAGDTFIDFKGNKYTVVTGGNTPSTPFDSSNIVNDLIVWGDLELEPVQEGGTGQGLVDYEANKSYSVGDIVLYNDKIYRCITAHTSTSMFDDTKWEEISPSDKGLSIWESNTAYNVDDIVIDSNIIWKCVVSHTSTTTFDESKWVCISGGEVSNGLEIVPLWEGEFDFSNSTQGAEPTSSTPMIELSDSISNFEYIRIFTRTNQADKDQASNLGYVPYLINNGSMRCGALAHGNTLATCEAKFYDDTHIFIRYRDLADWSSGQISRVDGIRKAKPIVSSGMKYETLWEGSVGNFSGETTGIEINLSDSIKKYAKLGVYVSTNESEHNKYHYHEVETTSITNLIENGGSSDGIVFQYGYSDYVDYVEMRKPSTHTKLVFNVNKSLIKRIVGIGEGVQIPTGVQAARVTLFEGSAGNFTGLTNPVQINLLDDFTLYDVIGFYIYANWSGAKRYLYREITKEQLLIAQNSGNPNNTVPFAWGYSNTDDYCDILYNSTSSQLICSINKQIITKIVGIKYIQPDSYSTEEKLIGTWIDDKPLYRKVFTGLSITLQWNDKYFAFQGDISLPLSNVDTLVSANGYGDNFSMPVTIDINRTTNLFGIRGVDTWTINSLAVEYTKN